MIQSDDNNLFSKYPELVKQWDYDKNKGINLSAISVGSSKKVWWKCEKGHKWQAFISNRVKGSGCPYCSNKKLLKGYNDLATTHPELIKEWDYEKNFPITPSDVQYGSSKKVWWIGKCGHSFMASLNARTANGTGCPYCCDSHAKLLTGFNDLATTNPDLIECWDYEKNGTLLPSMVMKGQHKKVWWKCNIGHSYQAAIYHRSQGRGCPICRRENQTSFPEQALFFYIKSIFSDAVSTDREILGGKELDIYVPSIRCGIEFDGSKWHKDLDKDILKDILCENKGISLIRIRDIDCPRMPEKDNVYIIDHKDYSDSELMKCINKVAEILKNQ